MRHRVGCVLVIVAGLLVPRPAGAEILCKWFAHCLYESPSFQLTVADKETGKPLADVHALAEWVQYGPHGRNGPLMVLDAVSGPDGVLAFPAWGPLQGTRYGIYLNHDPVLTLFEPGYKVLLITNAYPEGTEPTTRTRPFGEDRHTFSLEPFRGSPEEWVEQIDKAVWGQSGGMSEEQELQFRVPYLNRLKRIWAERDKLPQMYRKDGQLFWHIERGIKFLEEGRR
jgi:hypothetical protein